MLYGYGKKAFDKAPDTGDVNHIPMKEHKDTHSHTRNIYFQWHIDILDTHIYTI